MTSRFRHLLLGWLVVTTAGCVVGSHLALERLRAMFEAEALLAYQALSQGIREHETLLDTLALLQPAPGARGPGEGGQGLGSLYPAVHRMLRRDDRSPWPEGERTWLADGELRSQQTSRAALVRFDLEGGSYWLVRAGQPASFALQLDLRQLASQTVQDTVSGRSDAAVWLEHAGARRVVLAGAGGMDEGARWHFGFRRRLSLGDLPLDFAAQRRVDWLALPWTGLAAWFVATSIAALALAAWRFGHAPRQARREPPVGQLTWKAEGMPERSAKRRRTQDLVVAAPAAPAVSAAQRPPLLVTLRELDAEPPELVVARGAIRDAARQSRRTAEAIARLRRSAERADMPGLPQQVDWEEVLRDALELIEPECARLGVVTTLVTDEAASRVQADPVVLEQIVHHLLSRALRSLEAVAPGERRLELTLAALGDARAALSVRDTGPGLALHDPAQVQEGAAAPAPRSPVLARCAAMASRMGGSLTAAQALPRGAVFRLSLPLAT